MEIRTYRNDDIESMRQIWNEAAKADTAFPQDEPLAKEQDPSFFAERSLSAVADEDNSSATIAIKHGKHVGERQVGRQFLPFHVSNASMILLYGKLGFRSLGIRKKGYRLPDGRYGDLRFFVYPLERI